MEVVYEIEKPAKRDVHILGTTIATMYDVRKIAWYFDSHERILKWSIDLHDWEKVLKISVIEGFEMSELERFLNSKGYAVHELSG